MRESTKGILAIVTATVIWGLSSIYFKHLAHVPPLEMLSHRTVWSLVFFAAWLAARGRLGEVWRLLGRRRAAGQVALAAGFVSVNWFLFIYAVQIGHALEASLGYYILPLVSIGLGVVVFGERLGRARGLAVALAALGVAGLAFGLGVTPWVALGLAFTFGTYGMIKKRLEAGPVVSVAAEVVLLAPIAAVWLFGVHVLGWEGLAGRNVAAFGRDLWESLALAFSGPLTAVPLMLLSAAARRLPLGTVGVLQYINPSIQFVVATLVFGEALTFWHAFAFVLIWLAVALYSAVSLRQDRAVRRRMASSGTSDTTER